MQVKLYIHPDKKSQKSQYIRLNLEEYLKEKGIPTNRIIWRGPEVLSFTTPNDEEKDSKIWMKEINKKFEMKLSSVYNQELQLS